MDGVVATHHSLRVLATLDRPGSLYCAAIDSDVDLPLDSLGEYEAVVFQMGETSTAQPHWRALEPGAPSSSKRWAQAYNADSSERPPQHTPFSTS